MTGENYRFGYKASDDAIKLVKLCQEFGLSAFIVPSVMDTSKDLIIDQHLLQIQVIKDKCLPVVFAMLCRFVTCNMSPNCLVENTDLC